MEHYTATQHINLIPISDTDYINREWIDVIFKAAFHSNFTAMSFLTLDLNLLRVFDAVMTEQNLTRAAGHSDSARGVGLTP
jgi:hypothetical protein